MHVIQLEHLTAYWRNVFSLSTSAQPPQLQMDVLQQAYGAVHLALNDKEPRQHLITFYTFEVLLTSVVGFYRAATSPYVVDKVVK